MYIYIYYWSKLCIKNHANSIAPYILLPPFLNTSLFRNFNIHIKISKKDLYLRMEGIGRMEYLEKGHQKHQAGATPITTTPRMSSDDD